MKEIQHQGSTLKQYEEKDFVHVTNGDTDEVQQHPVPKAWLKTDLLPPGSKSVSKDKARKAGAVSIEEAGQPDEVTTVAPPAGDDGGSGDE